MTLVLVKKFTDIPDILIFSTQGIFVLLFLMTRNTPVNVDVVRVVVLYRESCYLRACSGL